MTDVHDVADDMVEVVAFDCFGVFICGLRIVSSDLKIFLDDESKREVNNDTMLSGKPPFT